MKQLILLLIFLLVSCKSEPKKEVATEDELDASVSKMWSDYTTSNPEFKKMKNFVFVFCLFFLSFSMNAQQFLWSTEKQADTQFVPLDSVPKEVLKFYDHYEFYYDGAGYSKQKFLETILVYGDKSESWKKFKNKILEIKKVTVFAIRDNLGRGSVILVVAISEKNVNMVKFSNSYEDAPILTIPFEREKFLKWFETLLN